VIAHYRRLVAYDRWANGATLDALRGVEGRAGSAPPKALALFAHIVAAEALWLGRLVRSGDPVAVWPEHTLLESAAALADLERRWDDWFAALAPERLLESVTYVNSRGEEWTNTVGDVLSHVVLHSHYHRGQIATLLRQTGHEPAYVDFIHAVRQGLVPGGETPEEAAP